MAMSEDLKDAVTANTDKYFSRTRRVVEANGDLPVTYAIFIRRPVVFAPKLALDFLHQAEQETGFRAAVDLCYAEGDLIGAGDPMMYITGPMTKLAELETQLLQKLGPACVAAYNAAEMCSALPHLPFIDMGARHCAGPEMVDLMAYAASVGSSRARKEVGAKGFIGNSTDRAAHFFGNREGLGTMPHALIGYAGSTVRAAEMFHEQFPDQPLTVLVDYFGKEITDGIAVAKRFPDLAAAGKLSLRLDTHGGRYLESLGPQESYKVLERHIPKVIRGYLSDEDRKHLLGPGVSAAAIWRMRDALDEAGFPNVKLVGSSGFGPAKCKVMAMGNVPLDVIGTGSFLPDKWSETYATADIIAYDGRQMVKLGREFLLNQPKKT
jgi:nicotinate phosphoribosyltransferase